jgi:hypothetical protein
MYRFFASVLVATILVGCVKSHRYHPDTVPITRDNIAGVWSGFEESGTYFYRIQFDRDGTGTVGRCFQTNDVSVVKILKWELFGNHLSMTTAQDRHSDQLNGRGILSGRDLLLRVKGSSGWQHNVLLRPESLIEKNLHLLQREMESNR